ncbi:M28 family metallopeptidase [uncultured Algimonas sp.]|uniref:M28 family metallopeptidase n=1 Tax=uncultured Algimonas sp. TaxID=1547920 RepID=UPI00262C2AB7|nr:M28 family metallopeptidase [uncultured Algimonas sp.]
MTKTAATTKTALMGKPVLTNKTALMATACAALLLGACGPATPDVEEPAEVDHAALISTTDLGRRIETLSGDDFMGRAPGTQGGQMTLDYLSAEMEAAGLAPMGENGTYFQTVRLSEATLSPDSTLRIEGGGGDVLLDVDASQHDNAVFWTKKTAAEHRLDDSELVFVGYGTVAPEFGWNDYAGLDVTGKTVVMLVNDPGFATKDDALFGGDAMTYYGRWTYKFEEAGRQGADAAIVIHQTEPASYPWEVVSGSWTGPQLDVVRTDGGADRTVMEGWIDEDTARRLFGAAGLDFDTLAVEASTQGFEPVAMGDLTLDAALDQQVATVESANVIGGVRGTVRPDEYVLYMAHWDHLGNNGVGEDHIYNGAVDNATGTAAIIEIGEAFVEAGAPERTALFMAVTAEESGLLGSAYYAANPLYPLENTVAGVNIDAVLPVGETKDMTVIGFGSSELEDRLGDILALRDMRIEPDTNASAGYFYRSDHISLAKRGVPMLYADGGTDHVTKGTAYGEDFAAEYTELRYHKPADEYDNSWDLSGIKQVTEILFELGYDLADSEDWPNWYDGNEFRALRDEQRSGME